MVCPYLRECFDKPINNNPVIGKEKCNDGEQWSKCSIYLKLEGELLTLREMRKNLEKMLK